MFFQEASTPLQDFACFVLLGAIICSMCLKKPSCRYNSQAAGRAASSARNKFSCREAMGSLRFLAQVNWNVCEHIYIYCIQSRLFVHIQNKTSLLLPVQATKLMHALVSTLTVFVPYNPNAIQPSLCNFCEHSRHTSHVPSWHLAGMLHIFASSKRAFPLLFRLLLNGIFHAGVGTLHVQSLDCCCCGFHICNQAGMIGDGDIVPIVVTAS